MRVAEFDFDLPPSAIALRPAEPRDAARLLVVRPDDALADRHVRDLPDLLAPGDALVVNDTRVIAARLAGTRTRGDAVARIEVTLHKRAGPSRWWAFVRPARKVPQGAMIDFSQALRAEVTEAGEGGERLLTFDCVGEALDHAIDEHGVIPLPPYIADRRPVDDADRRDYQTAFAAEPGAVAAPTAGLHFTPGLLERIAARGVALHKVTLHVGAGTFLPVKAEDTAAHRMHAEHGVVSEAVASALNAARRRGGRIVAVGTTSLRLLESAVDGSGQIAPFDGDTALFITPGYRFRAVDALMTNFHLPRSTLFMLVAAFSGLAAMQAAYAHAVRSCYRFYSYGDACLLDPRGTR